MSKSAKITVELLIVAEACQEQIDEFRSLFGEETTVTVAKARRVAHKLDFGWGRYLLSKRGKAAFDEETREANAAFEEVKDAAWTAFDAATFDARAVFKKATDVDYEDATYDDEVVAPAQIAYEKATAPAWAIYKKTLAPGRAAHQKAVAEAWARAWIAGPQARDRNREIGT
jgi:hypothetical protein